MKGMKKIAVRLLLIIAATLAPTAPASASDPERERIDGFKKSQRSIAVIEDAIAQGDKPTIAEQARFLSVFAGKIPELYPSDAKGGFLSKAKGEIWRNFPDFIARAGAFQSSAHQLEQAAALSNTDVALISQRLREVKNSCLSCHRHYKRGRP